jgi:OOP family OmpA-OmpF porin
VVTKTWQKETDMRTKAILAAGALIALATAAHADEKKGLYIGAGLGQFNVNVDNASDIAAAVGDFDSDDTSFKVFGGWRFAPFIAVELDYIDFGGPDDQLGGVNVKAEVKGGAPYVVGTLPLGPIELFAKVGYLFYDLDVTVAGVTSSHTSSSEDDLLYGAGIGITLFGHLNTSLEYELLDSSQLDQPDALWLSAAWRF